MAGKATPLLEEHSRLGARLTDFAGWEMPLQYSGVVAEHNAVRNDAGVFDVTHLGKLDVRGESAAQALEHACTAAVETLEPGAATYALVLDDDAGCIDDVFVYRRGSDDFLVVPNAANVEAVAAAIEASGGTVSDAWDSYAILAVQGPNAYDVFDRAFPGTQARSLKLHRFTDADLAGAPCLVARTGYTGEAGYEVYVPFEAAVGVFNALLDAGCAPVGLGARDTLRLEMGYALYGHEIDRSVNPLEAGLGWAVKWDADFRGRAALAAVREAGPARRTFGIRCTERGVPRQGYEVAAGDETVGTVTSGNHSPTLGTGIALARGPRATVPEVGTEVAIHARGRAISGVIVKPPFVDRGKRRVDE